MSGNIPSITFVQISPSSLLRFQKEQTVSLKSSSTSSSGMGDVYSKAYRQTLASSSCLNILRPLDFRC